MQDSWGLTIEYIFIVRNLQEILTKDKYLLFELELYIQAQIKFKSF